MKHICEVSRPEWLETVQIANGNATHFSGCHKVYLSLNTKLWLWISFAWNKIGFNVFLKLIYLPGKQIDDSAAKLYLISYLNKKHIGKGKLVKKEKAEKG